MYASRHYTGSDPAGSNEQHGSLAAQRMSAVRFLKSPDAIALTTAVCASDPPACSDAFQSVSRFRARCMPPSSTSKQRHRQQSRQSQRSQCEPQGSDQAAVL
jgi:hypothetical protein